jgi:YbdK family carboxylate-amine ligase
MPEPVRSPSVGDTLGVEEEYHLVDPATGELATRAEVLPNDGYVKGELQASQLEIGTRVCHTLTELRRDLVKARKAAGRAAAQSGAAIMAAGTHPFARWRDLQRVPLPRYDVMANRFGALADRQNICGRNVHVSVPDLSTALAIMNRARPYLPVLAALSSSSPFHEGVDTGFASFRTMWWSVWPTAGIPPVMPSVAAYEQVVADLTAGGLIDDASTLYWDVRPSIHYPTVEFRAADVCPDIEVAVLYAGLVRSLVRTLMRDLERDVPDLSDATLTAARWRAAREGIRGGLCDPLSGAVRPAAVVIRRVVAQVEPDLREHGEFTLVNRMVNRVINRGTSADRQRAQFARRKDLRQVVRSLVGETMRGVCTPVEASAHMTGSPSS